MSMGYIDANKKGKCLPCDIYIFVEEIVNKKTNDKWYFKYWWVVFCVRYYTMLFSCLDTLFYSHFHYIKYFNDHLSFSILNIWV